MNARRALTFAAVVAASLPAQARPDNALGGDLFRFENTDTVVTFDTARFRLFYTLAGPNAVPTADADTSGVPDHIEELGQIYEDALDHYIAIGFVSPLSDAGQADNGGDDRFDVYLVDFGGAADGHFSRQGCGGGTCYGYMVQENDFAGYGYPSRTYANRLLASHELFHAVQSAYSDAMTSGISEGTAVWASESFDPALADLEGFGLSYLDSTDASLNFNGAGPVDSFTYGTAVFWQWFTDNYGIAALVDLFEAMAAAPAVDWLDLLDAEPDVGPFAGLFPTFAADMLSEHRLTILREDVAAPYHSAAFRSFVASFRTICVQPGARDDLTVEVLGGVDGDDTDLFLQLIVLDSSDAIGASSLVDLTAGLRETLPLPANAALLCAQVINARLTGDGSRPALCFGAADEVADCVAEFGGGGVEGEGEGEGDEPPGGCGCGATSTADAAPLAVAALIALRRRQKRSSR